MGAALGDFIEDEFARAFQATARRLANESDCTPSRHPRAFLLGGQSGAGKTTLHTICMREFPEDGISINGDEYRADHPRFYELDAEYGAEAVAHTAAWAGKITEALIEQFSAIGYNLVIEGALRTAQVPTKTAELLRSRGYVVSLALMAVKPEISLLSCKIRYEIMRLSGEVPRAVDPAHHNKIVTDVVDNLAVLEASGLFDEVRLYARSGTMLFPADGARGSAAEALRSVMFGPWSSEEERHYAFLEEKLAALEGSGTSRDTVVSGSFA